MAASSLQISRPTRHSWRSTRSSAGHQFNQVIRVLGCEIAISSHAPLRWDGIRLSLGVGFMPLYGTIDSRERLFTGVGEGEVTIADAMSLLQALGAAKALSYRKLFDGRAVPSAMTSDELLEVSAKIRAYHDQGPVGALAMVCTPERTVKFARRLGALAAADRPMRMFTVCNRRAPGWTNSLRCLRARRDQCVVSPGSVGAVSSSETFCRSSPKDRAKMLRQAADLEAEARRLEGRVTAGQGG